MAKIVRIIIACCLVVYAIVAIGAASLSETYASQLPRPLKATNSVFTGQARETLRQADAVWNGS